MLYFRDALELMQTLEGTFNDLKLALVKDGDDLSLTVTVNRDVEEMTIVIHENTVVVSYSDEYNETEVFLYESPKKSIKSIEQRIEFFGWGIEGSE